MFYDLEDKKVKNLGENWSASNASIIAFLNELIFVSSFCVKVLL